MLRYSRKIPSGVHSLDSPATLEYDFLSSQISLLHDLGFLLKSKEKKFPYVFSMRYYNLRCSHPLI